jgi:superfamily I DNA and RNA helicase
MKSGANFTRLNINLDVYDTQLNRALAARSGKAMAEIVYGDQAVSEPLQQLVALFQNDRYDGTLYIGYPILSNVEGTVRVDALYVARSSGVVVFEASHLQIAGSDRQEIEEIRQAQDRYFAAINSKLLETPDLLERRRLVVPITIISISTDANFRSNDVVVATIENIPNCIPDDAGLSEEHFRILNSVIERTATIRPRKKRANVTRPNSRGGLLRQIEKNIANLDAWQKRAAIEMPMGPQRIRGLAGSGKTIVLALKAAFLHSREPTWRIALTFQTRSLYEQFRRLVRQFTFEFSKQEPDWDRMTIIHAWGSASSMGVYSEIARALGQPIRDFAEAKAQYGVGSAFAGICAEVLASILEPARAPQLYDAVLIDEGQDLPQAFFELVYLCTKPPKRIVYAYDELQNLSDFTMVPAEQLFGKKKNGHPNVQLRNEVGKPKADIILPVCYRNTPWALSIAHGLGFGTAREVGLIQMFDEPMLWKEIGYDVASGQLERGYDVALRRSLLATPRFFTELLTPDDAVQFVECANGSEELEWLSSSIARNLQDDELEHDDILIVVPEAITIRATAPNIMRALRTQKLKSHLVGVTTSRDAVFAPESIAITSIYRAKGNEAPMVYVLGAEYCFGGFNLSRKRNILFTAITRSRGWLRVSGVGEGMSGLVQEYQRIRDDAFALSFRYPTEDQLRRIRTLHRDRSSDELQEIEQDLEGLTRLMHRVDTGQISLDALPIEAQGLIRRLRHENSKTPSSRRKSN